jgi:prepilin-type N-terminal cleavage/methylation domain-containing protein
MRDKKGYTLIEVLLVAVLFTVIAAAVFPNLKQFYVQAVFDGAVQRMVKTFEYARARAVMEDAFLRLSFDTAEQVCVLEMLKVTDRGTDEFETLNGRFGKPYHLPDDLRFNVAATDAIFFNPDGSVGEYKIEIEDDAGRRVFIQGEGYFGKPTVREDKV